MKKTKGSKFYKSMYKDDKYSRLRVEKAFYNSYIQWKLHHLELDNPKLNILDIGCYTMELRTYCGNDWKYTGIDMLEKHKDIINLDLNRDSMMIVDSQFDMIFLLEIVEHVLYPDKLLKSCQKLLKEDGIICFSLPNENTLYHRIVMALGLGCDAQAFKPYKHVHFGTIRQQRAFLGQYFAIVEEKSYISTDMHKSRGEWIGKIAKRIPDKFWQYLANKWPSLFARGRIFVCKAI